MSDYTPYWEGVIRGFRTSGGYPWQVCIETPESKDGARPSVNFSRGQSVHVFTDEGLNRIKAEVWEEGKRAEETAWMHIFDGHPVAEGEFCDECSTDNPYRKGEIE